MRDKMKTLLILGLMLLSTMHADDIQVFTANTMNIQLDKKSIIKKVFYGDYESYKNNKKDIDNFSNTKSTAMISSVLVLSGISNKLLQDYANDLAGKTSNRSGLGTGLIVAGGVIFTVSVLSDIYKYANKDYENIYISVAVNSKGEKTMLKTLIVSNDKLTNKEAENIALEEHKKLILDDY